MMKSFIKSVATRPTIYLVNSNKTDLQQAPDEFENIKVLPHIPYIQDKPFKKEDYEAFKTRIN